MELGRIIQVEEDKRKVLEVAAALKEENEKNEANANEAGAAVKMQLMFGGGASEEPQAANAPPVLATQVDERQATTGDLADLQPQARPTEQVKESSTKSDAQVAPKADPKKMALQKVEGKLTAEEYTWIYAKLTSGNLEKRHRAALGTFYRTQDVGDFASTIKSFYKKAHK